MATVAVWSTRLLSALEPTALPWRRIRHEWLLLTLVACVALTPVYAINSQDRSRLCLTQALEHGRLVVDHCILSADTDRAVRAGHVYSDKAPGMSVLALPAVEAGASAFALSMGRRREI